MEPEELKELARQLSCPSGENGIMTGDRMNESNHNIIRAAIDQLALSNDETILEIGPGNGQHLEYLLNKPGDFRYFGIDISETMVEEAKQKNKNGIAAGKVSFQLSAPDRIDFEDNHFDRIFTVNTIYFWKEPAAYLAGIHRVLKQNGTFSLAFVDKSSMEKLPFTQYGFTLYDREAAEDLLKSAGFEVRKAVHQREEIPGNMGTMFEREFFVITSGKI